MPNASRTAVVVACSCRETSTATPAAPASPTARSIFAVARRIGGKNLLLYGFSGAAAFSVMHVFLPPHPGPVAASELFGANLGVVEDDASAGR